eukprot:TRINITY_DN12050_c0_g1_i1.p1 TRINITY_DN12050_c0_g1~~TRINITY_DN12050_c0_g1_i1.p1  ORF type:complete len:166 (+),score=43.28 TRINITY_DN12050_c0_g1_i1:15-512(+)
MTSRAYFIETNEPISFDYLEKIGVKYWKLDADNYESEGKLKQICEERGYTYKDQVDSNKINLKEKLPIFFEEHIHYDEEIRFFLNGSGYFDVRSHDDKWIRIELFKGDMIILPAGIYHRFAPDSNMFFHVMRLFVGEPIWTPYNRGNDQSDKSEARENYVKSIKI